jgi:hypothetical protein
MTDRWERYAPLSGVLAVVLWVIALFVGDNKTNKDKGDEILAAIRSNENRILLSTALFLVGTALFIWFLGTLRTRLLAAEGGAGRLTATAFAGGVATAVCLAIWPTPDGAAALSDDDLDASAASAMHHMSDAFFFAAEYLLPVLLVAAGLLAVRTGVLPRWLGWASFVVAVVLLIGPIGWAALIFAFPLWVLVVSVLLWRAAPVPAAAATPTP